MIRQLIKKSFAVLGLGVLALLMSANAAEVTASMTLPKGTVLGSSDFDVKLATSETYDSVRQDFSGKELRRTIYAGHTITKRDLQEPTLVRRNATVVMEYINGGLTISTYGRSLGQGAKGDVIEVMNINSRKKVMAIITGSDKVTVK